jgi:type IV pilus assembly protein PilO
MDLFKNRVITKVDWVIIAASLILLVIISIFYVVAVSYMGSQIDGVTQKVSEAQTKLSETRAIAAKKDGLLKDLQEVRQRIASFEGRLPTEKEIPRLLNQFQEIAEQSGVEYRSITAEPIQEQNLFIRIPFKVQVDGAYPEMGEFLRSLEFGDRFIKVENVEIGPEEDGSSEAKFTISTYMFVSNDVLSQSGETQS